MMTVNFNLINDTADREFSQRVFDFVERQYAPSLSNTVEGSVWHREENVWAHTIMVLNEFIRRASDLKFSSLMFRTGFLASIYHDVGKPQSKKPRPDGEGFSFHNHESVSANCLKNDYCQFEQVRQFFTFGFSQMQLVRFMIQVHLPYGQESMTKLMKASLFYYAYGMFSHDEAVAVYTICLLSDASGRISDNYVRNVQAVVDWIEDFSNITDLPTRRISVIGPTVYILSGPQASGKSTFAKRLRTNSGKIVHYIGFDEIRSKLFKEKTGEELTTDNFHKSSQYENEMNGRISKTLNRLCSDEKYFDDIIIIDATNATRKRRRAILSSIKNSKVVNVQFINPLSLCITRNDKRKPPNTGFIPVSSIKQNYFSGKMPMIDEFNEQTYVFEIAVGD